MSDIVIRNMKMPKSCAFCRFWTHCECLNSQGITDYDSLLHSSMGKNRHSDCPLVELPPHGKLIDAEELVKKYKGECWEELMLFVANAPTILEASKA